MFKLPANNKEIVQKFLFHQLTSKVVSARKRVRGMDVLRQKPNEKLVKKDIKCSQDGGGERGGQN